jgi:hypothetical protein
MSCEKKAVTKGVVVVEIYGAAAAKRAKKGKN